MLDVDFLRSDTLCSADDPSEMVKFWMDSPRMTWQLFSKARFRVVNSTEGPIIWNKPHVCERKLFAWKHAREKKFPWRRSLPPNTTSLSGNGNDMFFNFSPNTPFKIFIQCWYFNPVGESLHGTQKPILWDRLNIGQVFKFWLVGFRCLRTKGSNLYVVWHLMRSQVSNKLDLFRHQSTNN